MFTPLHVSHVRCHMSRVRCHVRWQSCGTIWWRVCYQRGLPRLVYIQLSSEIEPKYVLPVIPETFWSKCFPLSCKINVEKADNKIETDKESTKEEIQRRYFLGPLVDVLNVIKLTTQIQWCVHKKLSKRCKYTRTSALTNFLIWTPSGGSALRESNWGTLLRTALH